jgi:hypothetical protein
MNRRTVAAIAAASSVVALGLVAVPAHAATGKPGIINCAGKEVRQPKEIVLACGDDSVSITGITWSTWNNNKAVGKGTLVWNTCLPETCVAGIVKKYPVKVTLGGLASSTEVDVFSQASVAFTKGGPAALETGTYTLDNTLQG